MNFDTSKILKVFNDIYDWIYENIFNVKTLIEIGLILAALIVSFVIAFVIRKYFAKFVTKMRKKWKFLSIPLKLLMDHLTGVFFPFLLSVVILAAHLIGYKVYFVKTVAVLALIILVIDLVSHLIENKLLSKFISYTLSAAIALNTFDVYKDVVKFLDSYATKIGDVRVSIYFVIKGLFIFGILLWIAGLLSTGVTNRLKTSKNLTPSLKVLLGKVFRIVFYFIAVMFGLSSLGVDLTAFAVFSGAVGVGIGFGLQKIVSNLISGFILLLDNSIKPGDMIQLDDKFGTINEMGARYISVTAWDGTEYLIPNEDIVTGRVINWTHTDRYILLTLNIGVSYNSNLNLVKELILKAVENNERVLKEKPPACYLKGFGDSSVDFTLFCWISDPENGMMNVKSDIYFKIWDLFKENHIEIPFPQRDVHIKKD
jgi:small-conductance mechanosensitive channel